VATTVLVSVIVGENTVVDVHVTVADIVGVLEVKVWVGDTDGAGVFDAGV
jgi:hypothetical protein